MVKKYLFSIATNVSQSSNEEEIELHFDDNATEKEIESIVQEEYISWVCEKNRGGFQEIE